MTKKNLTNSAEVLFDSIPADMKIAKRWCLWRYDSRGPGKATKVPYTPSGRKAASTNEATWATYEAAASAYAGGGYDGVGFMLGGGWAGIDLDGCSDAGGELSDFAEKLVADAGSYAERSPSGRGLHILVRGDVAKGRNGAIDGNAVEVYGEGRYFTVTGDRLDESPATVEYAQPMLDGLLVQLGGRGGTRPSVEAWWPDVPRVADLTPWEEKVEAIPEAVAGRTAVGRPITPPARFAAGASTRKTRGS